MWLKQTLAETQGMWPMLLHYDSSSGLKAKITVFRHVIMDISADDYLSFRIVEVKCSLVKLIGTRSFKTTFIMALYNIINLFCAAVVASSRSSCTVSGDLFALHH